MRLSRDSSEVSNLDRIDIFGRANASMSDDSSHSCIDSRAGRLHSYLDMRLIKKWVLPLFPISRRNSIVLLDVGAGTGRMTRRFSKVASLCISIEPYPPFFNRLKASCNGTNVKFHQCTLHNNAKITDKSFDLIFLSGVLMYHNDAEALRLLQLLHNFLKQNEFVLIRDWGVENEGWGASPFGSVLVYGKDEMLSPPKGDQKLVSQAGFRCLRWRRSYPVNITEVGKNNWE